MTKRIVAVIIIILLLGLGGVYFWQRQEVPVTPTHTMTVTDSVGVTVNFPAPTRKIVTLTNADTETMVALGVKPIGVTTNFNTAPALAKEIADVTKVGLVTSPNLEQIVALHPDLVVASVVPFQMQLRPSIEKAGIPVLVMKSSSYQDILDRIRLFGEITDRQKAAGTLIAQIEKDVARERERYAKVTPKKILIVWGTANSFQLASSHTFVGDLVKQLPSVNLADQFDHSTDKTKLGSGFVALDMEYLSQADVDAVFLVSHGTKREKGQQMIASFCAQPAWQSVRAVREGHVYELPGDLFASNPNVRVAQSVAYIGKVLYGDGQ